MTRQSGFTLIEVLASGILSTVIGGAILSLIYLTNTQIGTGKDTTRLKDLQTIASEQIRQMAQAANGAMKASEESTDVANEDRHKPNRIISNLADSLQEIRFFGNSYYVSGGYKIGPGYLLEADTLKPKTLTYKVFTIGEDTVFLDSAKSYFAILPGRRGIISSLTFKLKAGSGIYTWPKDSQLVQCRNRN